MKDNNTVLPKHWQLVKVGDYVISVKGKKPKRIMPVTIKECTVSYVNCKYRIFKELMLLLLSKCTYLSCKVIPIIICLLLFGHYANSQINNTLLWKITGNNLQKPSYIYGTMHLTDKRVFNLGDSVLQKMVECEAFANEIYLDSLTIKLFEDANQKLDSILTEKYFDEKSEINEALNESESSSGIDKNYLKKLNPGLLKYFMEKKSDASKYMNVALDAYLLGIGKKLNKKITSLEYLKDQEDIFDSLSNSGKDDFISEEIFKKKKEKSEELIRIYTNADINALDSLYQLMPKELYERMIYKRNLKMIGMIDSVSHQMSVFYAVGAGHLPGSGGLIELLRNKGYTVSPVKSPATGKWEIFVKTLPQAKWKSVNDSINGFKVDMPVIPSKLTASIEELNLKMAYDFTTNLIYMTCGKVLPRMNKEETVKMLSLVMKKMSSNKKYKILKRTKIKPLPNGFFQEAVGKSDGENYFTLRVYIINNILYIIYAGNGCQEFMEEDRKRFFDSFSLIDYNILSWKKYDAKEEGFEVMMPENPKVTSIPVKSSEGKLMNITNIVSTDNKNGVQYFIQYIDGEGLYYPIDSVFLNLSNKNLISALLPVRYNQSFSTFQEYPSSESFYYLKDSSIVHYKSILCGSRGYLIFAVYNKNSENTPELNTFFNSFTIFDNTVPNNHLQISPDSIFTVNAPSEFHTSKKESYGLVDTVYNYFSYDKHTGNTWYVLRYRFSSYAFFENDSTLFSYITDMVTSLEDSICYSSKTDSISDTWEIVTETGGSHIKNYYRCQLRGNELYVLLLYIPGKIDPLPLKSCFFNSFKPKNFTDHTNLFIPKTRELMNDLISQDTIVSKNARRTLNHYNFRNEDISLIHQTLRMNFADDTMEYGGTRSKLYGILKNLHNELSVSFIDSVYHDLSPVPDLQNDAVCVLASIHTADSYALLKKILLKERPKVSNTWWMIYGLKDSLELASTLYPEILELIGDTCYSNDICDLTATLFDSLIISPTILQPFGKLIIDETKKDIFKNQYSVENDYVNTGIPRLLRYLDVPESVECLRLYSDCKNLELKLSGIHGLIAKSIEPAGNNILILSSNDLMRTRLYDVLKQSNKLQYFPGKYLTQKCFAASFLMSALSEDDEIPDKVTFIRSIDREYKGKFKRFHLYSIEYNYDGEKSNYLGVCGSYETDNSFDPACPEICYSPWIEYNKKSIEKDLDEYLKTYSH